MRWFETPNFDFVGKRKIAYLFSGTIILIGIIAIIVKGLAYGIDFSGGKEFVLQFQKPIEVTQIRSSLSGPLGGEPVVKLYGSPTEVLVRTDASGEINAVQQTLTSTIKKVYPNNNVSVIKTDVVGPRFAQDLKRGALDAIIFAMIIIFIYILIRFKNWSFSLGAVVALCHDVLIVLGIFTILSGIMPFSLQIDESIIAAFLTIVGYSINDTVVVFDRVRESMLTHKTMDYDEMINRSLNETLSRTVITSLTTLFVVTVLFIFGSQVLKGFSFALMLGIIFGTYSSLFIATAIVVDLHHKKEKVKA